MKIITPEQYTGRISRSGGKLSDLSSGLKFPDGLNDFLLFSLFIIPKDPESTLEVIIVNCKCANNVDFIGTPLTLNMWNVPLFMELAPNSIDLNNFDVYVGFGK